MKAKQITIVNAKHSKKDYDIHALSAEQCRCLLVRA